MRLALGIRNAGAEPLTLYLRGRTIAFDFIVADRAGRVVWQRLHNAIVPGIIQAVVLRPGQSRVFRHTWDLKNDAGRPIPPGEYSVAGLLLRDQPEPLRSLPVAFKIL